MTLRNQRSKAINISRTLGHRCAAGYLRNRQRTLYEALYILLGERAAQRLGDRIPQYFNH